ncbi:EF-hand domain-containing protein [Plasmodiophora brassicae]
MTSPNAAAAQVQALVKQVRAVLAGKGAAAFVQLHKALREADRDGRGLLNYAEFEVVLGRSGIFLTRPQMTSLARRYDPTRTRSVDINAFVSDVAGRLNGTRARIVDDLFHELLRPGTTAVTAQAALERFRADRHPLVLAGAMSAARIKAEFIENLQAFAQDGTLDRDAFHGLFTFVGASTPDDDQFVKEIAYVFSVEDKGVHHFQRREGGEIDPAYLASVAQVLKEKVRQKTRGSESEAYTLTRVFRHFDLDDTGTVDADEWTRALERFGILMPDKEGAALFQAHVTDGSGRIAYGDFVNDLYGIEH